MKEPIDDLHIDDFCKDTAKTLLGLFKRFPVKTTLYVEDISGPDDPDEFGLHSPRFEACFSTFVWLKDSDYIHFSSAVKQEAVEEAVLTHRSFIFLSAYESDDTGERTHLMRRIDKIKHVINSGTSDDLKDVILRYMAESREYR